MVLRQLLTQSVVFARGSLVKSGASAGQPDIPMRINFPKRRNRKDAGER